MKITKNMLLTHKKYRKMSLEKLTEVINHIVYEDYKKLEGNLSIGKARILYKKWRKK